MAVSVRFSLPNLKRGAARDNDPTKGMESLWELLAVTVTQQFIWAAPAHNMTSLRYDGILEPEGRSQCIKQADNIFQNSRWNYM